MAALLAVPGEPKPPAVVTYLGQVLPPAMMGALVVYCLKGVTWLGSLTARRRSSRWQWTALHCWKANGCFPIAGGTAVYMLLVQAVFA